MSTTWQKHLAQTITDPARLLQLLELPNSLLEIARLATAHFPLKVTQHYLSLIERGKPDDPLLRQVLPIGDELQSPPNYLIDPVGDMAATIHNGLLQKYQGRALLITTGACGIHCRYCFRRHYPYAEHQALSNWQPIVKQLKTRKDISEIILSGGDPLSLSDERLAELIQQIEAIQHIKRLRIHTRLPIAVPKRLTTALATHLSAHRLQTSLVLHCNHPKELHPVLKEGFHLLRTSGVTLLNQSVLLAGVNDNANILQTLSESLFEYGVLPYYLHLLDPVQGAAHFFVGDQKIAQIKNTLTQQLPGYLVPRIVKEIHGQKAKTAWELL